MSAATALQHRPTELTFHGVGSNNMAVFSSASASRPGERNWTYRDAATGEAACECRAAECGRRCWHLDWLETAWAMTQVAGFVGDLSDAALLATGTAAGERLVAGTFDRADLAVYWQARAEWLARRAATAAAPVAAIIARADVAPLALAA